MNYDENSKKCIDDFIALLNKDIYINKKMYEKYLDNYDNLFKENIKQQINQNDYLKIKKIKDYGYQIIEKHNNEFIERKLIEYEDYFDSIFKNIDAQIKLDPEQRKAILIDEDYSLVIAGAGSGKTTTMAAKVKYLIDKKNINPNKIILLAFTNKAAEELNERINIQLKLNVDVLTFHKLGMRFIREIIDKPVKIAMEGTMHDIIVSFVKNVIFKNKKQLKDFMETFDKYVRFDEKVFEFTNFDEYYEDYIKTRYEQKKNELEEYIGNRISQRLKRNISINGELLKSQGEVNIANYLYLNGIPYAYEKRYPHRISQKRSYIPDFTINTTGTPIYIEYYGLTEYSGNGNVSIDDIELYKKVIEKKKQLHRKYKTDLIELYAYYSDNRNYMSELKYSLKKHMIEEIPKTNKEIFYRLYHTSTDALFYDFIRLAISFITNFKEKNYEYSDFEKLIKDEKDIKLKKQLKWMSVLYRYYNYKIHSNYLVDFNDMINYAYRGMEKAKKKNKKLDYDYLIIDEYQDISRQRYMLAKRLSDIFQAKIVAVGDDWQSIFSFSGSDVDLFTNFYNLMGYAEIVRITKTYRNSQELIDVAGEFVSKNQEQFDKKLVSDKHLKKPIVINYYNEEEVDSKSKTIARIIRKLAITNPNQKILILGRYNDDVDELLESKYFKKGIKHSIICKLCRGIKIDFLTIHASKGLGYDQVILINALNDEFGFPSQHMSEELLKVLDIDVITNVEYPEERRLFYVALTRTKNKLYIICPYKPFEHRSCFVNEISNNVNVLQINP